MKQYVFDYANDLINNNKNNPIMRDDMRNKIEQYIECVLGDYKAGLISTDEALYLLAKQGRF